MNVTATNSLVLRATEVRKTFQRESGETVIALDGVSMEVAQGSLTALVGPDGAGKTTLIRLAAGLMGADRGELKVVGMDVAADPQQIQDRIGYMPQKFGLYEDLSVQENLNLYADLHGVSTEERRAVYPKLMEMTALGPFTKRLAGRLSGGMKQKLGLACTLVRAPDLLLLEGKVLAAGAPGDVTAKAAGRSFFVDPPSGTPARSLQAKLLDEKGIID